MLHRGRSTSLAEKLSSSGRPGAGESRGNLPTHMIGAKREAGEAVLAKDPEEEIVRLLMPSPIGRLAIEFRGTVVTRLVVQPSRREAKNFRSLDKIQLTDFLMEALGRLSEYFAGVRSDPEINVDLSGSDLDAFQRRVLKEVRRVPYGKSWSYKKLAEASGRRTAYNLVRSVLSMNPIPILIPCHRVLPTKGGAGAWIGGTKKKERLLRIEKKGLELETQ